MKGDGLVNLGELPAPLSVTLSDFLALKPPPRQTLLAPWLPAKGLAMVHAWRGVGKTHFGIGAAYAAAAGGAFLRWRAPRPVNVLYVDGEMPSEAMFERLKAAADMGPLLRRGDAFRLITPDKLPNGMMVPNLLTPEGQRAIESDLADREVVFFDNVATLFRTGEDQNAAGGWLAAQDYILSLRRRGLAVVLIDHDNKSGGNRGTSAKHDVLDTVIQLVQPSNYRATEGARFEVRFTKHRGFWGSDALPFEAQLVEGTSGPTWTMKDAEQAELDLVAEMLADGVKDRDIRSELGIGGSKLARLKRELSERPRDVEPD